MLKIVYLSQFCNIGGGEAALINLLSKLDRKKFEPIVILPAKGEFSKVLNELDIKTYFLYINPYLFRTLFVPGASFKGIYKLYKLMLKIKPNLVHVNNLSLVVYAGLVGKLLDTPTVATSHGPWDSFYFYQDFLNNLFLKQILANSLLQKNLLLKRKILPSKKVSVLYFGIDTEKFKPDNKNFSRKKLRIPKNSKVVTIVGRLDPIKDHLTFLKSANIILESYPNIYFLIAGSKLGDFSASDKSSYINNLNQYLTSYPVLKKRVKFLGFVNNIVNVYSASDVLVSSSLSESFGLNLAEGLACQIPVVATNKGNQHLIVKEGRSGFLIPPKNPEILAQKTLHLLKNQDTAKKFGVFGREHVRKNFNLDKYTKDMEKIYLNLMGFNEN